MSLRELATEIRARAAKHKEPQPYLYQPVEVCPELPAVQPCTERLELIVEALNDFGMDAEYEGMVLDVGCHTGWFCRAFARMGWRATGIDRSADWISTAGKMNEILPISAPDPEYVVADVAKTLLPESDVALCLSVSMYLFQSDGEKALHRISEVADLMFFDFGGMYVKNVPADESTIEEMIRGCTLYTESRKLGRSAIDRPLYLFWGRA